MGFVELENTGKKILERFPVIKRSCKRVYQLGMYAISKEKFKAEGNLIRVSPNDNYEYYFGYYDKSPWDITDRYMICLRVRNAYKAAASKEAAQLMLIDTHNNNKADIIAVTHSWNVQQGCMARWLGPDFKSRIIFNDYREDKYCSVIYNVTEKKEEKLLPLPVYDVSNDGRFAMSLDFSRLHRMRPGYGYANIPDSTKGELCPDKTCIFRIELESGKVTNLLKYTDLKSFSPRSEMDGAEHKVNHIMINPSGTRFMVLHRWFLNGKKFTRLITADCDGKNMYNLSDDNFASHCCWKNNEEILSFLRKKESGDHYYLLKDKTQEFQMLWKELNTDGHCSYSPDGSYIITDTYPNRKRLASIYLCKEERDKYEKSLRISRVFAPFRYDNEVRCDLHPRWNHGGDKICIDSVHEGKRNLYSMDIAEYKEKLNRTNLRTDIKQEEMKQKISAAVIPKIIHYVWLGDNPKSDLTLRCIESWKKILPDYEIMEWNEKNFNIESSCQYVREAYEAKKWAFVSDYIRLYALYQYGGIYFDTDLEVKKKLDSFLTHKTFMGAESKYTLCTALIGSIPEAPWIHDLLTRYYEGKSFYNQEGKMNLLPNTKLIRKFFEENHGYEYARDIITLKEGITIYPEEYFSPLNCFTNVMHITDKTVTIHHYDNSWKSTSDKMKKKIMASITRIIGEDKRAKLVSFLKHV